MIPVFALVAGLAFAQKSVCELFVDLQANDGARLIVTGDLLISKVAPVATRRHRLGDNRYISDLIKSGCQQYQLQAAHSVPVYQLKRHPGG